VRVGFDFRAMQIGHQFRGIGQVVREGCRHLAASLPDEDRFVLFTDPAGPAVEGVLDQVGASDRVAATVDLATPRWGRAQRLKGGLSAGQSRTIAEACDVFVQFDSALGVPPEPATVVVVYDQIPVLLGDRYPLAYRPTYRAARQAGLGLRLSAQRALGREAYERGVVDALRKAGRVLAISEHTARTTAELARSRGVTGVGDKIEVAHLGHDPEALRAGDLDVLEQARMEGEGLDRHPFLFFMGGVDERRRIDLLITAFNDLRARGRDLKLVFAGYDFQGLHTIFTESARRAIEESSYAEDIHLLGFVSPTERAWLYRRAEAFVFPTEHEGFGLPVVEAVATGCTVVTFDTTSISELGGPNRYLCEGTWPALAEAIATVLDRPEDQKRADAEAGARWAEGFTWDAFGAALARGVTDLGGGGRRR